MRFRTLATPAFVLAICFAACGPTLPSTTPLGGIDEDLDAGSAEDARADAPVKDASVAPSAKPPAPPISNASAPPPMDAGPPKDAAPDSESDAGKAPKKPKATAPKVAKCDDSGGSPASCNEIQRPGGGPCAGATMSKLACAQLVPLFKPKVSEKLVGCLIDKSKSRDICDPDVIKTCSLDAIKVSCPTKRIKTVCAELLSSCSPTGMEAELFKKDVCEHGIAALKPEHHDKFIECAKRECKIGTCIGQIMGP